MYDDFDDDLPPEELLHRSAAPLRRDHPMDGWQEVTPGAPSTWSASAQQGSSPSGVVGAPRALLDAGRARWRRAREVLGDRWTGWWERRRQAQGHGPSERAWGEALEYFALRYRERSPDPLALGRLVRRNGTPDWSNPFPQGHPRHYDYHPGGLLLMDITVLLEGMTQALDDSTAPWEEAPRHRDQLEWVPLEAALQDNENDAREHSLAQQRLAMASWAMVLAWGNGLSRSLQEVHHDNLTAITAETLLVLDPTPWGLSLPQIAAGAVAAGLLNLPTAQALLRQRALMDRPQPEQAPAAVPVPQAPPLPIDAWLKRRAAAPSTQESGPPPSSVAPPPVQDFDSPNGPQ